MKHGNWIRIGQYLDRGLDEGQLHLLEVYHDWLIDEAMPAGGVGPGEADRMALRHVGDALLFAAPLHGYVDEIWDFGSGVGLPGIPLGILLPKTHLTLFERSGRRVDLLKRAVRILDLQNVDVIQTDVSRVTGIAPVIVSRGSFGLTVIRRLFIDHLAPGGIGIVGGSWRERPDTPGWETFEIPGEVLDQSVWLLIMRRQ